MKNLFYFTGGYTEPVHMSSGETVPGRCKGITCFRFDEETGEMGIMAVTPATPNPSYVVADSKGPYLYCVNELKAYGGVDGATVSAYEICAGTGECKLINSQFTCGADPCFLLLSPDGGHLLGVNYSGGSVCVFPVLENHGLGPASCVLRHQGKGVNPERQEGPHPHQILLSPEGEYIYVADLGLDVLACYGVDWKKGWIMPTERPDIAGIPGQGIRHGVFDRKGERLYVMTEMACQVNVYAFDQNTGETKLLQTISAMPEKHEVFRAGKDDVNPEDTGLGTAVTPAALGGCLGAAIRLHPNGKWLYVSVRGSNHLAAFEVEGDGRLKLVQTGQSGGEIPRDFVISPNGRYLLAAHQDTDAVCVFAIDQASGMLRLLHTNREIPCVTVLALWQK